jgi:hypothetical protein
VQFAVVAPVIHAMPMTGAVPKTLAEGLVINMKSYGTKADGTPITDEMIEEMAAEAERGLRRWEHPP